MAVLYITCGKVCSGKSVYIKRLAEKENIAAFSADELMLSVYDECLGENHRKAEFACMKYLIKKACELVGLGISAAVDAGFWFREERDWVRGYLEEKGVKAVWLYFEAGLDTRQKRLYARNVELESSSGREYIIDDEMLKRFDSLFEAPGEDEEMEAHITQEAFKARYGG